ncbi:MAG: zinc ribbon domain-containing protein [Promethearchaeota archaeon]
MEDKYKKYTIICPMGIGLLILLTILLLPLNITGQWQWWLIMATVILPMYIVGDYLDKRVFKVKGSLAKIKEKGVSLAEKNPNNFIKCPNCGMSVRKEAEFCSYCAQKMD